MTFAKKTRVIQRQSYKGTTICQNFTAFVWKATDANMTCHKDLQYELGKQMIQEGNLGLCVNGLHWAYDPLMALRYGHLACYEEPIRLFRARADDECILGTNKACSRSLTLVEEVLPTDPSWNRLTSGVIATRLDYKCIVFENGKVRDDLASDMPRNLKHLRLLASPDIDADPNPKS